MTSKTEASSSEENVSDTESKVAFDGLMEQQNLVVHEGSTDVETSDVGESSDDGLQWELQAGTFSEDESMARRKLAVEFAAVQAATNCSHSLARKFYGTAFKNRSLIAKAGDRWVSYRRGRRRLRKTVPDITVTGYFRSQITGKIVQARVDGSSAVKDNLRTDTYGTLEKSWSRVRIADILLSHWRCHGHDFDGGSRRPPWLDETQPKVKFAMAMDSVPLHNASTAVMEVICIKLHDCLRVWPIAIHIGKQKEKELFTIFDGIINEVISLNVEVTEFLADSTHRSTILNAESADSYHGCLQCKAVGVENPGDGADVVWPPSTMGHASRNMNDWEQDERLQRNGIKGFTPLKMICPDLVKQVPIDIHQVLYLGMGKRVVEQMLQITAGVKDVIDQQLSSTLCVLYPAEFIRKPRPVDVATYGSAEWRHLIIAGFPVVSSALDTFNVSKGNKLWGYFVFLVRGMLLPDDLFTKLKNGWDMDKTMKEFYHLYVEVFAIKDCAPEVHMFYHVLQARKNRTIGRMTTEPFQCFYTLLKKSYEPGTRSTAKQMLEHVIAAYMGTGQNRHVCVAKLLLRERKEKARVNDSIIITETGFYEINDREQNGDFICRRFDTRHYKHPAATNLPFHLVRVFRTTGMNDGEVYVHPGDIIGKGVKCNDVLSYIPDDALLG